MPSNLRLKALVVAMGLAAVSTAFAATPSAAPANNSIIAPATRLRTGDLVVGPMALTRSMRVTLSLHWRNQAELDAFIADPHHKNLTHAKFMAQYGPDETQVNQVEAFLRQQGFSNVQVTPDNLLVSGQASVANVQAAFHTQMIDVRTEHGRLAFANSTEARIPNGLQGVVHEVLGLQNVHRFHVLPMHTQAGGTITAHNPTDFAAIYNADSTAMASTINAGIITSGSMVNVLNDFKSFLSQNSLPSIPMNVVKVDGGGTATNNDDEWDLDSQDIVGISGGVKALYLYDTASLSTQDLIDDFSKATTDNVVRVVNVSIGGCETGTETNGAATGDDVFLEADSEGMTFSVSSGDSGADECGNGGITPSWPADSQYVIAVGGTTLSTSGTTWESEVVWNDLGKAVPGATGGSPSTFEAMPNWQKGIGQNAGHSTRGVPDVAMDASYYSGANVIVDGGLEQIGGTSLASPLFVGVWARTLAANPNLGFAAPLIYQDAASHYSTDFHDVTSGNNSGETAAVGWDYTTGFGTINIANFVANVASGVGVSPHHVHNDINGDSRSDLLFQNPSQGYLGWWLMNGTQVTSTNNQPMISGYSVVATGDFNGDGKADIVWSKGNALYMWLSTGSGFTSLYVATVGTGWKVVGAGDVNGDGKDDLLFQNSTSNYFGWWLMNGAQVLSMNNQATGAGYFVGAVGDFNGDGKADIAWTNSSHAVVIWTSTGSGFTGQHIQSYGSGWQLFAAGDVNGDGDADLLFHNPVSNTFCWWLMNGPTVLSTPTQATGAGYYLAATGDFNEDGKDDLLWTNNSHDLVIWTSTGSGFIGQHIPQSYGSVWSPIP